MKQLLLFLLLSVVLQAQDFPLKVQIVEAHWQSSYGFASGRGFGNVKAPDQLLQGFDFVYDSCAHPFLASHGPEVYRGRWKDPHKLEIETRRIGSDKVDRCVLKVTTQNFVYVRRGDVLQTEPLPSVAMNPTVPGYSSLFSCVTDTRRFVVKQSSDGDLLLLAWHADAAPSSEATTHIHHGQESSEGSGACRHTVYRFAFQQKTYDVEDGLGCTDRSEPAGAIGAVTISENGSIMTHAWCK